MIKKVDFVGVRTDRLQEMAALFRDVLSLPVVREARDLIGFELADGTILELYGPGDDFHSFFRTGPVVGFRVADFDEAHRAMIGAGIEFLREVQRADGIAWRHFRAPDGTILEVIGPTGDAAD